MSAFVEDGSCSLTTFILTHAHVASIATFSSTRTSTGTILIMRTEEEILDATDVVPHPNGILAGSINTLIGRFIALVAIAETNVSQRACRHLQYIAVRELVARGYGISANIIDSGRVEFLHCIDVAVVVPEQHLMS